MSEKPEPLLLVFELMNRLGSARARKTAAAAVTDKLAAAMFDSLLELKEFVGDKQVHAITVHKTYLPDFEIQLNLKVHCVEIEDEGDKVVNLTRGRS